MQSRPRLTVLDVATARQALREAMESFYSRCHARNLSQRNLEFYRSRLEPFARYLDSQGLDLGPGEVTPAVIRDFLAAERERGHCQSRLRGTARAFPVPGQ